MILPTERSTRRAWLRRAASGLAAGTLAVGGCGTGGADLVAVCGWPEPERALLAESIAPARVAWVGPSRGGDPTRLISDGLRADLVLGGPVSGYVRLEREGRLADGWSYARRTPLAEAHGLGPGDSFSLGDPRDDPGLLAVLRAFLSWRPWAEGFADLVRFAGASPPVGFEGSGPLATLRGDASGVLQVPGGGTLSAYLHAPEGPEFDEGGAVLAGGPRRELAARLLESAVARVPSPPVEAASPVEDSRDGLLADLLGACLVEAREELSAASGAIRDHGDDPRMARAAFWMVQPPPWPPASVGVLAGAEDGAALVELLAEQVAPESADRRWLLRSWSEPEAALDGRRLDALANAADGRLAREPRFRAWLRGEWTAWARQRYRRAARIARGEVGPA